MELLWWNGCSTVTLAHLGSISYFNLFCISVRQLRNLIRRNMAEQSHSSVHWKNREFKCFFITQRNYKLRFQYKFAKIKCTIKQILKNKQTNKPKKTNIEKKKQNKDPKLIKSYLLLFLSPAYIEGKNQRHMVATSIILIV